MSATLEHFIKYYTKNNKYVVEYVKQITHDVVQLKGKAIVTHVGAYGRFKFTIDDKTYTTEGETDIAVHNGKYFNYNEVQFNINVKASWQKLYMYSEEESYWKSIKPA